MDSRTALTLRRAALLSGALLATLVAHAVSEGGLRAAPVAPLLWLAVVLAGIRFLPGRAEHVFRRRRPVTVASTVVAAQTVLHLVLWTAPWALGVVPHHRCAIVTPLAVATHALAAALLTAALLLGDRLLAMAVTVARAILGLRPRRRGTAPAAWRIGAVRADVPRHPRARPRSSRGPPAPVAA